MATKAAHSIDDPGGRRELIDPCGSMGGNGNRASISIHNLETGGDEDGDEDGDGEYLSGPCFEEEATNSANSTKTMDMNNTTIYSATASVTTATSINTVAAMATTTSTSAEATTSTTTSTTTTVYLDTTIPSIVSQLVETLAVVENSPLREYAAKAEESSKSTKEASPSILAPVAEFLTAAGNLSETTETASLTELTRSFYSCGSSDATSLMVTYDYVVHTPSFEFNQEVLTSLEIRMAYDLAVRFGLVDCDRGGGTGGGEPMRKARRGLRRGLSKQGLVVTALASAPPDEIMTGKYSCRAPVGNLETHTYCTPIRGHMTANLPKSSSADTANAMHTLILAYIENGMQSDLYTDLDVINLSYLGVQEEKDDALFDSRMGAAIPDGDGTSAVVTTLLVFLGLALVIFPIAYLRGGKKRRSHAVHYCPSDVSDVTPGGEELVREDAMAKNDAVQEHDTLKGDLPGASCDDGDDYDGDDGYDKDMNDDAESGSSDDVDDDDAAAHYPAVRGLSRHQQAKRSERRRGGREERLGPDARYNSNDGHDDDTNNDAVQYSVAGDLSQQRSVAHSISKRYRNERLQGGHERRFRRDDASDSNVATSKISVNGSHQSTLTPNDGGTGDKERPGNCGETMSRPSPAKPRVEEFSDNGSQRALSVDAPGRRGSPAPQGSPSCSFHSSSDGGGRGILNYNYLSSRGIRRNPLANDATTSTQSCIGDGPKGVGLKPNDSCRLTSGTESGASIRDASTATVAGTRGIQNLAEPQARAKKSLSREPTTEARVAEPPETRDVDGQLPPREPYTQALAARMAQYAKSNEIAVTPGTSAMEAPVEKIPAAAEEPSQIVRYLSSRRIGNPGGRRSGDESRPSARDASGTTAAETRAIHERSPPRELCTKAPADKETQSAKSNESPVGKTPAAMEEPSHVIRYEYLSSRRMGNPGGRRSGTESGPSVRDASATTAAETCAVREQLPPRELCAKAPAAKKSQSAESSDASSAEAPVADVPAEEPSRGPAKPVTVAASSRPTYKFPPRFRGRVPDHAKGGSCVRGPSSSADPRGFDRPPAPPPSESKDSCRDRSVLRRPPPSREVMSHLPPHREHECVGCSTGLSADSFDWDDDDDGPGDVDPSADPRFCGRCVGRTRDHAKGGSRVRGPSSSADPRGFDKPPAPPLSGSKDSCRDRSVRRRPPLVREMMSHLPPHREHECVGCSTGLSADSFDWDDDDDGPGDVDPSADPRFCRRCVGRTGNDGRSRDCRPPEPSDRRGDVASATSLPSSAGGGEPAGPPRSRSDDSHRIQIMRRILSLRKEEIAGCASDDSDDAIDWWDLTKPW